MIYAKGIIIEKGNPGTNNLSVSIDHVAVQGNILSEVPLKLNFAGEPIGKAKVYKSGSVLKADIEIELLGREEDVNRLYPAIGGIIVKRKGNVIEKFTLTEVSLCSSPNADNTIANIGSQRSSL